MRTSTAFQPIKPSPGTPIVTQPHHPFEVGPRVAPKAIESPFNFQDQNRGRGQQMCTNKQNSQDGTLSKSQKRNEPHEHDVFLTKDNQNLTIRHRQANYKLRKHGHDFDLPYTESPSGWKKTPRTPENLEKFKKGIADTTLNGKMVEGTYRGEQRVLHCYDSETGRYVIYDAETNLFISAWKLDEQQAIDLKNNGNVGKY